MKIWLINILLLISTGLTAQIITGAERTEEYLPLLKEKRIAFAGNHTSMIKNISVVDSLLSCGINVVKIFSPEHGFRGTEDAGKTIQTIKDSKTGLPVISLYGKSKKPQASDLEDIDIIVFDIQDVGVRYFTYISTMHYLMEACAENKKTLIILDRPNPNGYYIDGPVLDTAFRSFVGMHPVPIVHGMTIGEFAQMINGEGWLGKNLTCELKVIPCKNYTHQTIYTLPVKPSPNLSSSRAIELYSTLCLFEGTPLSVGRGTPFPFQVVGHPSLKGKTESNFNFTPVPTAGATNPPLKDQLCYGYDFSQKNWIDTIPGIKLELIIDVYKNFPDKNLFFNKNLFFDKLAGNSALRKAIIGGKSASEIREGWQKDLELFRRMRAKYLLYPD
ncbi:MAG: DUF1343 domain-containing protein [Bacteroidetes bacterium HGW-Bacteroidetes-21]|jgi:uncharacterized protein YbbC (DUF1343 family)|nr:MAG: DUF1343 domain-containing protein [Bacteroidetes bacterium HGW-Bacteroidetes-21]